MSQITTTNPVDVIVQPEVVMVDVVLEPSPQVIVELTPNITEVIVEIGQPYALGLPPPAPSEGTAVLKHTQETPASEWLIATPWGVRAASILVMVGDEVVNTTITENSPTQVGLRFPTPTAGIVILTKGA